MIEGGGVLKRIIAIALMLCLFLTGCGPTEEKTEQLFRTDTVVNIPLNPEETESETEAATQPETTEATEEIQEATEPAKASSKSSSSKTSSSKTSSSTGKNTSKATEPPETTEPATEPPETESPAADVYDISDYCAGSFENAVTASINAYREEAGFAPLTLNGQLCGIASVRAYEVCVSWSHSRPNGGAWYSVLSDYGFGYGSAAEELARSAGYDADSVVGKWIGNESAAADLLDEAYTTIGVGIYDDDGTVYIAAILLG